jgi:hypothetical protein
MSNKEKEKATVEVIEDRVVVSLPLMELEKSPEEKSYTASKNFGARFITTESGDRIQVNSAIYFYDSTAVKQSKLAKLRQQIAELEGNA